MQYSRPGNAGRGGKKQEAVREAEIWVYPNLEEELIPEMQLILMGMGQMEKRNPSLSLIANFIHPAPHIQKNAELKKKTKQQ